MKRPARRSVVYPSVVCALSLTLLVGARTNAQQSDGAVQTDPRFQIPATDEGLPGEGTIHRMDWFGELWAKKRASFAASAEQDQGAVVFLGDSITQDWETLSEHFEGMHVANRGISGDTSRGMLIRMDQDVLALDPAAVVLLLGTNDLADKDSPETISGNLKLIISKIQQHNAETPIVLNLVFPSSAEKDRPSRRIQAINRLYRQVALEFPQVTVLDTFTLFANEAGDAKIEEMPDLLHPNEIGYAKWAKALRPIFATLGFWDTEPDDFQVEEGFVSLFNGEDLTGWGLRPEAARRGGFRGRGRNAQAPSTAAAATPFEGTSSEDGRLIATNGRLVVTTPHEEREIAKFFTTEDFEGDFILKLEFRATPNADSGIFLRQVVQLQCRDYALAGPYTELANYQPQEWNEIVITVKDDVAHCTCNGEVLEEALRLPPSPGPIGVEGDRGQMEYRRIRINTSP